MALDILPIQATSVPCERSFSSAAETGTNRRNRLGPTTIEALQMLKSWYKNQRLNFTSPWRTLSNRMGPVASEIDYLAALPAEGPGSKRAMQSIVAALAAEEGDHDDPSDIEDEPS